MANINIAIPEEIHKKLKINSIHEELTLKEYIIRAFDRETSQK